MATVGTLIAATAAAAAARPTTLSANSSTGSALPSKLGEVAASRARGSTVVIGQEGPVQCFNPELSPCELTDWGALEELVPVVRPPFLADTHWQYRRDLVSAATATETSLTYTIRSDAYWYWGGRKLPVTYKDFVYTWRQIVNPRNDIGDSDRPFYQLITGYTHTGLKRITFHWTKPYGPWKTLFLAIYPSAALAGMNFNKVWVNCVCGRDGTPVSDGPYYLSKLGQGAVLKPNPYWYGRKPRLRTVVFKALATRGKEIQAMRSGAVDLISPGSSFTPGFAYGPWLKIFLHTRGIANDQTTHGGLDEQIQFQFGPKGNPLLRSVWFRRALMMGIDRRAVIAGAYGPLDKGLSPRDNLLYAPADSANYRPDFRSWNYNPNRALALLRSHCTGGPSVATRATRAVWTCAGVKASLRYKYQNDDPYRVAAFRIIRAELERIGIQLGDDGVPKSELFGANGVSSPDNDLANFAVGWFAPDQSIADWWGCGGPNNYSHYCNPQVTSLLRKAGSELDPARTRDFRRAETLFARDVAAIPLFDKPFPLFRNAKLLGVQNNPDQNFTWNLERWHWKQ